jgi:mxaA protein
MRLCRSILFIARSCNGLFFNGLLCASLLVSLPTVCRAGDTTTTKPLAQGKGDAKAIYVATEIATEIATEEPRAFGYQVGDVFSRRVLVRVPANWQLDPASIPPTRRGQPIELRRVQVRSKTTGDVVRYQIDLHYQVFYSPPAVRVLELAPWPLKFNNGARTEALRVDAWPVSVSPLVPQAANNRRGLGDMQPDAPPPLIHTQAQQRRLLLCATLALLLAGGLAVLHLGPPWRAARKRPFGRAWRALRALPTQPNATQWQTALRCMHQALNACAGKVVFKHNLSDFVRQQPRFAPLQNDLTRFLDRSQAVFFGQHDQAPASAPADMPWLTTLARRLHDTERGLV